jgi:FMN phosphatase YigB (HAD superfamily)
VGGIFAFLKKEVMEKAVIFDIDGTLADISHRVKYLKTTPKDWKNFNSAENILKDTLILETKHILDMYRLSGYTIILITGRNRGENALIEKMTMNWLREHNILADKLFMREYRDKQHDTTLKRDIYNKYIKDKYDVVAVFEDRSRVVDMWRGLGLQCYQVNKGYF